MTVLARISSLLPTWFFTLLFGITLTQTELADVLYPAWLGLGLYGAIGLYLSLPKKKLFLFMLLAGVLSFLSLKSLIGTLEFWGDEIGVIEIASKPFLEIAPIVQTAHAAVPPLDYQNLHWWLRLVPNIPLIEREFIWRVPYMFYHCVAAALFAQILYLLGANSKNKFWLLWIGWAVFFTNPLGIEYSLDIRFYALLILSVVSLLYGLVANTYTKTWWLGLIFLAGLNAITFHIIAWITFLLYGFMAGVTKKGYLPFINLLILISICLVLVITNTKSESDLNYFNWNQYDIVVLGISSMRLFFVATGLACIYWLFKYHTAPAFIIFTLLTALSFVGVMMTVLVLRPYDGIGLRTFLPIFPHLLVICMSLVIKHQRLVIAAALLVVLQLYWNKPNLIDHAFIERKIVHIKPVCIRARENGQAILVISSKDPNQILTEWDYSFIAWYTKNYNVYVQFAHPNELNKGTFSRASYQLYDYDNLMPL